MAVTIIDDAKEFAGSGVELAMMAYNKVTGKLKPYFEEKEHKDSIKVLSFPTDLKSNMEKWKNTPVLTFSFFETGRFSPNMMQKTSDSANRTPTNTKGLLVMRMPDNGVSDSIQYDISGTSDGFIDELLRGTISGYRSGGITGAVEGGFKASVNEFELNVAKKSGAYATNLGSNKAISSNKGVEGFNGVQSRSWTFVWRLVARSQPELKERGEIIRFLHRASNVSMSGTAQNYSIMKVPMKLRFEETIIGGKDAVRYTPRVRSGICHIANIRVSTPGDNGYMTLAGTAGDPSEIELELTIKEITKPTAELFENSYEDTGWKNLDLNADDIFGGK